MPIETREQTEARRLRKRAVVESLGLKRNRSIRFAVRVNERTLAQMQRNADRWCGGNLSRWLCIAGARHIPGGPRSSWRKNVDGVYAAMRRAVAADILVDGL